MDSRVRGNTEQWVSEAIEQARIILAHLESGGRDDDFLRPHALSLLQTIDHAPTGDRNARYLL